MVDATDYKIVHELNQNARLSMKELGEKVHLTGQAASSRVLKLEEAGIISGYQVCVNEEKMGNPVHVFINIYTRGPYHRSYFSILDQYQYFVRNNYKISGDGCYLLECRFPSNEDLDEFITNLSEHVEYKLSIVLKNTLK
ncbi:MULTISPECIES: Lrp/AsnC family transcriptional regulator [Pontibacillus]|uniref:Lrp/AsnC family transcriptional regulator n=1 Tax=Pontibacillus chungwhensis TaxID=265426 RepID=A0ABY8USS5_9BACI|nr:MULTISPECIES: Lrp/AsnC family transcriptional regulator [Pontibacillus]MCD5323172.1 Lrp/AsnC family transcriptional regulator [Pontibacillus sp. HN14]WIF96559.1 Lrp/AsnC family transcriptional regulator [Pontibacillus chungwhensis]